MLVTVNCLLTASPSPQSHLTSLLQSIVSNSPSDQSDLTLSSGQSSVSLHTSLLCSLSPLLSSLLLSSSSLTTILLPSVSPCSLPLARELIYTGQCKGSLVQLEDAVLLLDLLGVQIQNEVVACCETDGQIREEGPFFVVCESTNNNLNEKVKDTFPTVQKSSRIIGLPFDETFTQEQFVSIIVGPDDDFDALNLNDIQMESLPSFDNSDTLLKVQEVEEKNESCEGQGNVVSYTKDLKKVRSYPCNECGYIATQKSNLKRHQEAKHFGIKTIEQYHGNEVGVNEDIKMRDNPSSEAFHTLNVKEVEEELHSNCQSSKMLIPDEKIKENCENTSIVDVVGRVSKLNGIKLLNQSYSCNQCEYITSQKCNLKRHNQAKHKGLKNVKQDYSNKGKVNENSQDLNIKIDQRNESFDIPNFNKNAEESLPSFDNLDILLSGDEVLGLSETKFKEMNYPCNLCNYIATLKVSLERHYQAKHGAVQNGKKGQSNEVEECEDIKEALNIGVDNLKQQLFPCNQCEYVATQNGHLKRHVLAKHSLDRVECNFCEKIFTLKESLRRHIKSFHENHTYPCPECNFVGKRPETLKYHVQCKHSEEKAICDECGYQAATERLIKKHKLRTHKGIKYPCDKCDYQATEKSTLKHHLKSTHEKIRFKCDVCTIKFTKKTSLNMHRIFKHNMNM